MFMMNVMNVEVVELVRNVGIMMIRSQRFAMKQNVQLIPMLLVIMFTAQIHKGDLAR